MLTFIVLGYIPGTHSQLTFSIFMLILGIVITPFVLVKAVRFISFHHRTHQLFLDLVSL